MIMLRVRTSNSTLVCDSGFFTIMADECTISQIKINSLFACDGLEKIFKIMKTSLVFMK